jgi:hypothetical protein
MKKLNVLLILIVLGIMFTLRVSAQRPPAPPSDPTLGGNQPPAGPTGGAPIDPGTGIFLILAAGYGLKKGYDIKKKAGEKC